MKHLTENTYDESEHKRSPWGDVQTEIVFGDTGIRFVATASHGGFILSGKANRKIPKVFRIKGGAYEEDCDSNIVFAFLFNNLNTVAVANNYEGWPALLKINTQANALLELQGRFGYPAKWAVHSGETLPRIEFDKIQEKSSYVSYDAYLGAIKELEKVAEQKTFKIANGMKIRFKNSFQFTVGGETIELNDFKAVNSGSTRHPIWRFQVINNPKHWFLANLSGWRAQAFELISA